MFTDQQRSWIKGFIVNPGGGGNDAPPADDQGGDGEIDQLLDNLQGDQQDGDDEQHGMGVDIDDEQQHGMGVDIPGFDSGKDGGPTTEALVSGLPGVPEGLINMTSTCSLENRTGERLSLVAKSLHIAHGQMKKNPDLILDGGKTANWEVENTKLDLPVIGNVSASGCEGTIQYLLSDGKTVASCHFKASFSGNLPLLGSGENVCEMSLDGPRKGEFDTNAAGGDGKNGVYSFILLGKGGGQPSVPGGQTTVPGGQTTVPGGQPQPQSQATCLVTIVNKTQVPIDLTDQGNDTGDFTTNPPNSVAPGGSATFAYTHTPGGNDPGCHGSATFSLGQPMAASWRVEWINPVGQKNEAKGTLTPESAGFGSLEQAGQGDENVPFTFTLTGGPQGGGTQPTVPGGQPTVPGGQPTVPGGGDPDFKEPPKSKQPTLRKGDKNPDGWVEYLQEALNTKAHAGLTVDGDFGAGTLKAVLAFQKANKLQVDGTVGNQTWAALRDGTAEAPSTDGRKPHSFEEKGKEARFFTEKGPAHWSAQDDTLYFDVVSTGEEKLDADKVTIRITPPGGKARVVQVPLGKGDVIGTSGDGAIYNPEVPKLTADFPSVPPGAPGSAYQIEAYMEQELGGDSWKGQPAAF